MIDGPRDDAFLLAGGTAHQLEPKHRTDLVRLADGRIGYASRSLFQPVGHDDRLEQIGVVTGSGRGTSVLSLVFDDGELRETAGESSAVISKRLRTDGYVVSSQPLPRAAAPPPEQDVEDNNASDEEVEAPAEPARTAPVAPTTRAAAAPAEETPAEEAPQRRRDRFRMTPDLAGSYGRQALTLLRLAVLVVGGVVVAILVISVLLLLAKANQKNDLVTFFRHASKPLAWKFKNLFEPRTMKANITENYLLAAAVYLVVTVGLARVLVRLRKAVPVRRP